MKHSLSPKELWDILHIHTSLMSMLPKPEKKDQKKKLFELK